MTLGFGTQSMSRGFYENERRQYTNLEKTIYELHKVFSHAIEYMTFSRKRRDDRLNNYSLLCQRPATNYRRIIGIVTLKRFILISSLTLL